jgi:hypothetical protein
MNEAHPHDAARAERLLYGLAGDLRRLPVHSTLSLHLRALQTKRAVLRWRESPPDEASRRAVFAELASLRSEIEAREELTLLRAPEPLID